MTGLRQIRVTVPRDKDTEMFECVKDLRHQSSS